MIPIGVAIVVAAAIVGIGEAYLQLGESAIYLAIALMVVITGVAAYTSSRPEHAAETASKSVWGQSIWGQSIMIPIGVAIVVAAAIVGIGEAYLQLGESAIYLAIALMVVITGVAAYTSSRPEHAAEAASKSVWGQSIWGQSIMIPIGVAIVVAAAIVGIGEAYLQLGESAIYLAIALMVVITVAAAYLSQETGDQTGTE